MKPLVVKVGGAFLEHPEYHSAFFAHLNTIKATRPVVLVHGGGAKVQALFDRLGKHTHKIDGLRVTPKADIPDITAALAGQCSTELLSAALSNQINAVALTLADGGITISTITDERLGYVGEPAPGDATLLTLLLERHFLPIINSIGATATGELVNVNADLAATVLARLLAADLLLLSDVPGVLDGNKKLLPSLDYTQFEQYVADKVITDGMIVKVQSAFSTADALQAPVIIGAWQNTDQLHSGDLQNFGTTIYPQTTARPS